MESPARYEVHVTVQLNDNAPEKLAALAEARGYRYLHIQLDQGQTPSQPMLSWRQAEGIEAALLSSRALEGELATLGMSVARVKVEVDLDAAFTEPPQYLEAHYKVALSGLRRADLERLARELGVHLSRNARVQARVQQGSLEQRFVTARGRSVPETREHFANVELALGQAGYQVLNVHREAVLYDSNLDLDRGWSA